MAINSVLNRHTLIICANMIVKNGDRYLMIRRSPKKIIAPSIIHTIGGKVDQDEDPSIAAERELKEETGLAVDNIRLRGVVTEVKPAGMPNWQIFHFLGDYAGGMPAASDEGEFVWLTAEEIINSPLFPSIEQIVRDLLDESHGPVFARYTYNEQDELLGGSRRRLGK